MVGLLRNPKTMKKVQNEVRRIVGNKKGIIGDDLDKMLYLNAMVKETLHFHPPIPLLVPRESIQDAKIQGNGIATRIQVFINVWAIGRDPGLSDNLEKFQSEKFLTSLDFRGHDFQLILFVKLVLANLMYNFDWTLPGGTRGGNVDMTESTGVFNHRKFPLNVVATPYSG
ncbi:cytochrome P450 736A117-like [Quercus suber]|uniref:cytochrome P450 736A117-like n=1 Tax=Quercus suber TaxID=58331 RepID=UPI000CE1D9F8|nr:cytochrome P450 71A1-like [Quercus suber]